jgi:hypothetical protein
VLADNVLDELANGSVAPDDGADVTAGDGE